MARRFYSRAHYQRVAGYPDPPEKAAALAAWRKARTAAGVQANAEMMARFAPLTAENAMEAIRWQDARIEELTQQFLTEEG